jgi:hypothetical protein
MTAEEEITLPLGEKVELPDVFQGFETLSLLRVSNGDARLELFLCSGTRHEFWLSPDTPFLVEGMVVTFTERRFDKRVEITLSLEKEDTP